VGIFREEIKALVKENVTFNQNGVRDTGLIVRMCLYVNGIDYN
jgi:hypothetical protein